MSQDQRGAFASSVTRVLLITIPEGDEGIKRSMLFELAEVRIIKL